MVDLLELKSLIELAESKGISASQIRSLIESFPSSCKNNVEESFYTELKSKDPASGEFFLLEVEYSKPIRELIKLASFDWINNQINFEGFCNLGSSYIVGTSNIKAKLFHFDRKISAKESEKEIFSNFCRPSNLQELLFLAIRYPDLQKMYPINATYSFWLNYSNFKVFPSLRHAPYGTCLDFERRSKMHSKDTRFLAISLE